MDFLFAFLDIFSGFGFGEFIGGRAEIGQGNSVTGPIGVVTGPIGVVTGPIG
jgi:hypothetical protein